MEKLSADIISFLKRQHFVVVTTLNSKGHIHNACKDIVEADKEGKIFLLDLYLKKTFSNLKKNNEIAITAVDEHHFKGYCLRGRAKIIAREKVSEDTLQKWNEKINSRISKRLVKNIQGVKGHPSHPEIRLPKPQYMIVVDVKKIDDLTPQNLRS